MIWNGENVMGSDFWSSKMGIVQQIMVGLPFWTQKWPMVVIYFLKLYWFEMTRNAIESDLRSSKMVSSDNFFSVIFSRNVGSLYLITFWWTSLVFMWIGVKIKTKSKSSPGQVSNFAISAFGPITTKYDLVETKRMILSMFEHGIHYNLTQLHLLINKSWKFGIIGF